MLCYFLMAHTWCIVLIGTKLAADVRSAAGLPVLGTFLSGCRWQRADCLLVSRANSESIFNRTRSNAGNYRNALFFFFFSWRVLHTCEIQQNTTERSSGRTAEVCGVVRPEKHGRHMIVILTQLYVHCPSSSKNNHIRWLLKLFITMQYWRWHLVAVVVTTAVKEEVRWSSIKSDKCSEVRGGGQVVGSKQAQDTRTGNRNQKVNSKLFKLIKRWSYVTYIDIFITKAREVF